MPMPPRLRRALTALALLGTVVSCASPTPYGPGSDTTRGYRERRIEEDRYRVTFDGNSLTRRETVETYLLFRAAELTLEKGYDYFVAAEMSTEASTEWAPRRSTAWGYGHWHTGFGHCRGPYFFGSYGYPAPYHGVRTVYRAVAYIVLRRGEKPADDPAAFDAREVMANLGPEIRRPADEGGA